MKKVVRLFFILVVSFNMLHAYSALEDLLLSKAHSVDGTFGAYDFTPTGDKGKFDWAFTTSSGKSYQLLGNAPSDDNAFGWAIADIVAPEAVWSMFSLDIDGNGKIGKFEWILVGTNFQAVYKLDGTSEDGSFDYSDPIELNYTMTQDGVIFSASSQETPSRPSSSDGEFTIDTQEKATSVAMTTMSLIGTTSSLTKGLSSLATLGLSAPSLQAKKLRAPTTQNCSGGGSMSTNLNYAELQSGVLNISVSYDNCVESSVTTDGTLSLSGNIDLATFQVSNLTATLDHFTVSVSGDVSMMNGTIEIPVATTTQISMILNATVEGTIDGKSVQFEYRNYALESSGNSMHMNGTIVVDYTPDSCVDGTYTIETISPITTNASGAITGGSLKVNGQLYTFNANGTVSTTINGETITIKPEEQEIEFCN